MNDIKHNYYAGGVGTRTAYLGMLLGLAVLFGYVEAMIPIPVPVPGIKLGLANIVVAAILYIFSWKEAVFITALRVVIIGFLFGNMFSIVYGLSGALLSLLGMSLLKKTGKFGIIGVSALGGVLHNVGQVIMATIAVIGFPWRWYLPILMLAGLIAGILIGIADGIILPRIHLSGDY